MKPAVKREQELAHNRTLGTSILETLHFQRRFRIARQAARCSNLNDLGNTYSVFAGDFMEQRDDGRNEMLESLREICLAVPSKISTGNLM